MKHVILSICLVISGFSLAAQESATFVNGYYRIQTTTGYLDLGSANSGFAHFITDRPKFYFNTTLDLQNGISTYTNDYLRVTTPSGYLDFGPGNSGYAHFITDRPRFYFNRQVDINGPVNAYSSNDFIVETNEVPRLTIKNSNGDVGINTTNPMNRLQIGVNPNGYNGNDLVVSNSTGSFAIHNIGTETFLAGNRDISLRPGETTSIHLKTDGNVGIGTSSPTYRLDVQGESAFRQNTYFYNSVAYAYEFSSDQYLHFKVNGGRGYVGMNSGNDLILQSSNGNVGIGTTSPDEKLTVKGNIHAEEVRVDLNVPGPDYVFEEDYDLAPLAEIAAFIKQNKHLPEIPKATDMEANGISLGEMNMLLLKKIEELTLHAIAQQKQIELQRDQIKALLAMMTNMADLSEK